MDKQKNPYLIKYKETVFEMLVNHCFQCVCFMVMAVAVTGTEAIMPSYSAPMRYVEAPDSLGQDTVKVDSLREVLVMGDSLKLAPIYDAVSQSLKRKQTPSVNSLGDVLNQVAPNAMDIVLHPFGFAERKKVKKRKKMQKILREYDQVTTQDIFRMKLDSIVKMEGLK